MEHSDSNDLTDMPDSNLTNMDDSQVQALRQQLQRDISDLISEDRLEIELQRKKVLYNQIMDGLHERHRSPRVDPAEKLPSDIMAEIVLYISDDSDFIPDLLVLTLVSKRWRAFILSEPLLWNYLHFDNRHDLLAILSVQIHLSARLPLQIELNFPEIFKYLEALRPILLNHRDRIGCIEFYPEYIFGLGVTDGNDTNLWKFLAGLGSLPNLRRIGNSWIPRGDKYNIKRLLDNYSSLRRITSIPFTIEDLQAAKDRLEITHFMTSDSIEAILPILETKKGLRKVTFLTAHSRSREKGLLSEECVNQPTSTHQLGWTELVYDNIEHFNPSLIWKMSN
ncbi:hypothetical protein CPB86DRAFT_128587 [Serendipita vermifera]|nr:hypothetical protein CPB86DRAFT_128587 [Serendipita vermifera]